MKAESIITHFLYLRTYRTDWNKAGAQSIFFNKAETHRGHFSFPHKNKAGNFADIFSKCLIFHECDSCCICPRIFFFPTEEEIANSSYYTQ